MIIKYDLKKFFKERGLQQSFFAKKIGESKQLFNYKIKKGDISLSTLSVIAESMDIPVEKLTKLLNDKYIRIKV